jgi:hypothetical protein
MVAKGGSSSNKVSFGMDCYGKESFLGLLNKDSSDWAMQCTMEGMDLDAMRLASHGNLIRGSKVNKSLVDGNFFAGSDNMDPYMMGGKTTVGWEDYGHKTSVVLAIVLVITQVS